MLSQKFISELKIDEVAFMGPIALFDKSFIGAILKGDDDYGDVVSNYFPNGRFVQKHEMINLTREELLSTYTLYQCLTKY